MTKFAIRPSTRGLLSIGKRGFHHVVGSWIPGSQLSATLNRAETSQEGYCGRQPKEISAESTLGGNHGVRKWVYSVQVPLPISIGSTKAGTVMHCTGTRDGQHI